MQDIPTLFPDLRDASDPAIAVVPWDFTPGAELRFGSEFAALSLDKVDFPLGRPKRPGMTTIGDLARGDQVIVWARKKMHQLGHFRRGTVADLNIMLQEPRAVSGHYYWMYRTFGRRISTFLMHDLDGFGLPHKTAFLPFGTRSVPEWRELDIIKTHEVSLIASHRNNQPGHKLRHVLAGERAELRPDMELLGRKYAPFVHKRDALAPYRFSVVIENSQQPNYFSEKLIDAILCQTVPIYWGCPNIGDFFDTDAFLVCQSLEDLRAALKNLNADLYETMLPKLLAQQERAAWYGDIQTRAALAIYERLQKATS